MKYALISEDQIKQIGDALDELEYSSITCAARDKYAHAIAIIESLKPQEPVAWNITHEKQDGTRQTILVTGRYKDAKDACDFGEPVPLFALEQP